MVAESEDRAVVSYSVKELLQDIKSSVDKIEGKIDGKADIGQLEDLSRTVVLLTGRVSAVENRIQVEHESRSALTEWRRYAVPTLLTIALLVVAVTDLITK